MRISDWSSDVCSSDLQARARDQPGRDDPGPARAAGARPARDPRHPAHRFGYRAHRRLRGQRRQAFDRTEHAPAAAAHARRSEEHTSELQSLMRISYAVFCLKKKNIAHYHHNIKSSTAEQTV